MCFNTSKGNHDPAVVSQAKTASGQARIDWECAGPQSGDGGHLGVEGFEVILELKGICIELDDDAPLATYPQGESVESVERKRSYGRTTGGHRTSRSGSPRICVAFGSDTRLAAMGLSTYDIQRQGRWKSQAVEMYIRRSRGSSLQGTGIECDGERNTTRTTM